MGPRNRHERKHEACSSQNNRLAKQQAVNGDFASGFDYLVVALLDRINPRSRFFVFEHEELDALLSAPDQLRTGGKRTLTMSQRSMNFRVKLHEEN